MEKRNLHQYNVARFRVTRSLLSPATILSVNTLSEVPISCRDCCFTLNITLHFCLYILGLNALLAITQSKYSVLRVEAHAISNTFLVSSGINIQYMCGFCSRCTYFHKAEGKSLVSYSSIVLFRTLCMLLSAGRLHQSIAGKFPAVDRCQELTDNHLWCTSCRLKAAGSLIFPPMSPELPLRCVNIRSALTGEEFCPATATLA